MVHPDDRKRVDKQVKKSLEESSQYNMEYRVLWPNDSEHNIAARELMNTNEKNQQAKMTGGCFDITEQENRQRKIREQAAELELKNKQLERSNERLQEFAYVASHDLQEPLRMVSSFVQLLQRPYKNQLDPEADEFIQFAISGTERMKALINDLHLYSRIDSQGRRLTEISMQNGLEWALMRIR
ncbi:MAG: PAS domain-containing protein [Alphaproteobacteria bacterium]|nr:PAS domain-containing protein [Alphaproteobacteria bacterium]